MDIEQIATNPDPYAPYLLSQGIRIGELLLVSGQVGIDGEGELVSLDDFETQADQAFRNLQTVLEAGGSGMDRVVKVTIFLTDMAANFPKVNVAYTKIATISTDAHHTSQEFRNSVGAQWPFLEDPGRIVQQDLEIQEYTDPDNDPMIPHTLVLKPGLVVHKIYDGYWFWGRPSFTELWQDLRDVSREIRADWDLGAPGLRAAWDAGDLSHFHGWERRRAADAGRA